MDLSIITVTWNSAKQIAEQIRSVAAGAPEISYEQVIIDNHSRDGTPDLIRQQFPQVRLVELSRNRGFAYANNIGAASTRGEYLLFLNPDMVVAPGSLDKLVRWLRARPKVGVAGVKLVDEQGQVDIKAGYKSPGPRRFPTLANQLAIVLKTHHLFPSVLNRYLYRGFDVNQEQEVDSVRGAFMAVRRELVNKLGWAFDPRYFIWFEDVDLCREAKRLGYQVRYTPVISCLDRVGTSFAKRNFFWKQRQFFRSMVKYFWKWR
ncbi:MAG: glycosyltransferase family 2 protein [Candidatus Magasanikbacteria bacterium]|nr:glycosyltransferase family 2 protein [Candidatus Magasanikbacteria bacterium]